MSIRNLFKLLVTICVLTLAGCSGGILDPKGQVGVDEKNLIILCTILMLLVVIPVIVLTLYFAWKYRASRDFEIYTPKWAHSTKIEAVVWSVPILIIIALGVITWRSTHALDPYAPLEGKGEHLTVEVVSLNWKWLFIYPGKHIATLNYLEIPVNKQIEFQITSDAPMNAFFIPQLASQIYAMAGMRTRLHAIANKTGVLTGFSANFSGPGFADMNYKVYVVSKSKFNSWANTMAQGHNPLNINAYAKIAAPNVHAAPVTYSSVHPHLFNMIMNQFTVPHKKNFYHRQANKLATGV